MREILRNVSISKDDKGSHHRLFQGAKLPNKIWTLDLSKEKLGPCGYEGGVLSAYPRILKVIDRFGKDF